MCKVLWLLYQCGHPNATIYPHVPCPHYLANTPLSGLDPGYKTNLRRCRAMRIRKVKTLKDEFCTACDARLVRLSPAMGARELALLGEAKKSEKSLWLSGNVEEAQYWEDRMVEENVVDSEESEMEDPLGGEL